MDWVEKFVEKSFKIICFSFFMNSFDFLLRVESKIKNIRKGIGDGA